MSQNPELSTLYAERLNLQKQIDEEKKRIKNHASAEDRERLFYQVVQPLLTRKTSVEETISRLERASEKTKAVENLRQRWPYLQVTATNPTTGTTSLKVDESLELLLPCGHRHRRLDEILNQISLSDLIEGAEVAVSVKCDGEHPNPRFKILPGEHPTTSRAYDLTIKLLRLDVPEQLKQKMQTKTIKDKIIERAAQIYGSH